METKGLTPALNEAERLQQRRSELQELLSVPTPKVTGLAQQKMTRAEGEYQKAQAAEQAAYTRYQAASNKSVAAYGKFSLAKNELAVATQEVVREHEVAQATLRDELSVIEQMLSVALSHAQNNVPGAKTVATASATPVSWSRQRWDAYASRRNNGYSHDDAVHYTS